MATIWKIAPGEGAELRRRHRERPGPEQRVFHRHRRFAEQTVHSLVERDGVLYFVLHANLKMVVQVLADAGEVVHDGDAARGQQRRRTDARQLQNLRRSDAPRGQDGFAGCLRDASSFARLKGAVATFELSQPGVYPYFCERHRSMRGEIRVK